ncbi:hypothetical protein [Flavilitoribacter nigricans]|uniref:hypothetical protein n=1 Tax=Flavilitoribacter nigricans TaxID=70997 RepID=UPI001473531F|nr:hypothetical protein [Flavilitoribacter nigricans]
MKKGMAVGLSIVGMLMIIFGVMGAFGKMDMGSYTWILLILGIIFFPTGIGLMKTTRSS